MKKKRRRRKKKSENELEWDFFAVQLRKALNVFESQT